ncbi:MAG TPA: hypothetical protein VMX54_00275 [Vicinamibacteria bacterium]|nr:hypothetical protein [Vicinamibacteria bacterium]
MTASKRRPAGIGPEHTPPPDRHWTAAGIGGAAHEALLRGLAPSALWSLLLGVLERRASARAPAEVLRQWRDDPFTRPASVDQRTLLALDATLHAAAEAFEAVELSPLAPLGACSVIGLGSQNRIVSALRGTEVVADPTSALALECARRLRERPGEVVRLATSHRCVRAQAAPRGPGFAQHFRLFCLATAGRERKDHGLLVAAVVEQVATWLRALSQLETQGYAFPGRSLSVLAAPGRERIAERVCAQLQGLPVSRGALEHRYYGGLRFSIFSERTPSGGFPLIDGGTFDWLTKLTSNARLVFVASGMGSQLAAAQFRRA